MRVVRWVIVVMAVALCGGVAAFLTLMLLKALDVDTGYRYTAVAVVYLMICWSTAPKLIRWANSPMSTPPDSQHQQDKHRPF